MSNKLACSEKCTHVVSFAKSEHEQIDGNALLLSSNNPHVGELVQTRILHLLVVRKFGMTNNTIGPLVFK